MPVNVVCRKEDILGRFFRFEQQGEGWADVLTVRSMIAGKAEVIVVVH